MEPWGHSFLRHFAITLDYAMNALMLRRPGGSTARALDDRELAFRWANAKDPLVVVPVFVNERGPYDFCPGHRCVQHTDLARTGGRVRTRYGENFAADGWRGKWDCVTSAPELIVGRRRAAGEFGGGGFGLFDTAQRGVGMQVAGHSGLRFSAALPRDARLPTRLAHSGVPIGVPLH
jgi:hypothetical protein